MVIVERKQGEFFPLNIIDSKPIQDGYKLNGKRDAYLGLRMELRFESICLLKGWEVSKPICSIERYDYVVKIGGQWKTVQVKAVCIKQQRLNFARIACIYRGGTKGNKRPGLPYSIGDFDLLFATTGSEDWLIPFESISTRWTINVDKYADFKISLTEGEGRGKSP